MGEARFPVACLSFSPDGRLIAGATDDRVCVWDVSPPEDECIWPKAGWKRRLASFGAQLMINGYDNGPNGSAEEEECPTQQVFLGWSRDGSRILHGFGEEVSNFDTDLG